MEVFEFTVVRRHSGSAHMVSLGFFSTASMHTLSYVCQPSRGKQIKMCVLPAFWINMTDCWQNQDAFQVCPPQVTVFAKQETEGRYVVIQNTWETRNKNPLELTCFSGNLHFSLSWKCKRTFCYLLKEKTKTLSVVIVVWDLFLFSERLLWK